MKNIPFLNWRSELENAAVDAIGNDFILLENTITSPTFDIPFKVDVTTAIIGLKGTMRGSINLKPYVAQSPCLMVVLADQILQYEHISDDFSGLFIVMSRRFMDSLNIQDSLPLFLSVHDNPFIPLTPSELDALVSYYNMLQRAIQEKDHPHRMEVAKYLTLALFYGLGYQHHQSPEEEKKSKQDVLVERFFALVQAHYKEQRGLEFYANKLCITPKYLSKVVKEHGGKSAADWIDSYVALEAKALLKSTNMTIQQISDELNFPSQSFFGKYFKRQVGISPSEYKRK